jgi:ribosomal protein S7
MVQNNKIIQTIVERLLENIKKEKINEIVYHSDWYKTYGIKNDR